MHPEPEDSAPVVAPLRSLPSPAPPPDLVRKIHEGITHPPAEPRLTWWQRLQTDLDWQACAVGVVMCGCLLYAMLAAIGRGQQIVIPVQINPQSLPPPGVVVAPPAPAMQPIPRPEEIPASTTPVMAPARTNAPALPTAYPQWR